MVAGMFLGFVGAHVHNMYSFYTTKRQGHRLTTAGVLTQVASATFLAPALGGFLGFFWVLSVPYLFAIQTGHLAFIASNAR
jgi:hypothetical protein